MADVLSPWQQTGMAAQQLGNSLNNITVGLAQQRFARQMAIQHMLMQQQQMMQQQALNAAHANLYGEEAGRVRAQAARDTAAAQLDQATVDAATKLGDSAQVFAKTLIPSVRPQEMLGVEGPLTQSQDTQSSALSDALSRIIGQGMRSAGLKGEPQRGTEAMQQAFATAATPMTPDLGAAILTHAHPIAVGSGDVVWNPATKQIEGSNPNVAPHSGLNIAALQAIRSLAEKPMGLETAMDPNGPLGPAWFERVRQMSTNAGPNEVSVPAAPTGAIVPPPVSAPIPEYPNEKAARDAGHGSGSKVKLKGVGIVQLR